MTTKTELTPERLRKLADSWIGFAHKDPQTVVNAIESMHALNEYAEILRGSEPVYQINFNDADDDWYDCTKIEYDKTWRKKRTLYTHPQPVKKCEWKYSRLEEGWETQCKLHQYPSRLITFKFCPFCGGEIVEVK